MDNYYLLIVPAVWLLIAVANREARLDQSEKLSSIISGDWGAVKKAKESFETFKNNFGKAINSSIGLLIEYLQHWMRSQYINISGEGGAPWKLLGYLLQVTLLAGFLYADIIVIANNLFAISLLIKIPEYLQHYEIAIAFGSFFSVIVGSLIANELYGVSELSDWKEQVGFWRNIAGVASLFLIFSGSIVITALGLARFTMITTNLSPETSAQFQTFANIVISLIVPINSILASMLIVREGFKGILALLLIIISTWLAILYLVIFIVRTISSLTIFVTDIVYRFLLFLFSLIGFFLFTPIDTVTAIFRKRM